MTPSIETKRLLIRPYRATDFKAWQEAYLNLRAAQNRWDLGPRDKSELTLANFKKLLQVQKKQRAAETFYDFAVFRKDTEELLGSVALMDLSRGVFQNAYIGYRVFNNHWSQGFGKEMVHAGFRIGFDELKLHRIEAGIDPLNRRSIFLARSLGMRREGVKRKALYLNEKWQDIMIYAITCEELGMKFRGDLKKMTIRAR